MNINEKVKFAVACLYELSQHEPSLMNAGTIAHRQGMSVPLVQSMLQLMETAGLVENVDALGYKLHKPLRI